MATAHPQPTDGVWDESAWDRVSRLSLSLRLSHTHALSLSHLSVRVCPGESTTSMRWCGWLSRRSPKACAPGPASV